ncbi:MAG: HU family DNA-binding protein [Bacteroidales bacterium]|jgi:predicted histone-like DNA-binding protein|nr:HU family DNA-binding protein [Bacteroidales bacterium]
MAIKYTVKKKTQAGVVGGGERKYYAVITTDGELTIDDLVKEIEKFSSLSEPDIRGVIVALENAIQDKLANSQIVRLDKLGSFYPTLSSEGKEKEEEVNERCIKKVGINYRPGARILQTMQNAGYKKVTTKKKDKENE